MNTTNQRGAGRILIGSAAFGNVASMERLSGEDRAFCVPEIYKNNDESF